LLFYYPRHPELGVVGEVAVGIASYEKSRIFDRGVEVVLRLEAVAHFLVHLSG
jgi:hypothetical protein